MKQHILFPLATLFLLITSCGQELKESVKASSTEVGPISLVIHGGAGTIKREMMTDAMDSAYRVVLRQSLQAGYALLESGASAEEAVVAAIMIMEDSELFNAGKGSVFTNEGKNEMDASVMDGKTRNAGAVAGLTTVRNPIQAAVAVMNQSEHVMMIGAGAEKFAKEQGITLVDPSYFYTERRFRSLERIREREKTELDHSGPTSGLLQMDMADRKFGTVGAVALDREGNIYAGTSTGGMTNKRYGRVGDVPIIGAGTYADNATCGLSATGHGEYFIRAVVGHNVASRMRHLGESLQAATHAVVMEELVEMGGEGGIVALDRAGNISMTFNSEGMYRGYMNQPNEAKVFIYKDEVE
jgi:L-asparaginase / beta-aspartyl-peptidase